MATHCSVLAWRIPGMGEAWWAAVSGSHRIGQDRGDLAAAAAASITKRSFLMFIYFHVYLFRVLVAAHGILVSLWLVFSYGAWTL